jgi:hypothetical protein
MTNTFAQTFVTNTFDWTKSIALANSQSRHEFETTVLSADGLSDDQLKQHADDFEKRYKRALEAARRSRRDPEPMFLSAMRNWSRGKAIGLLRDKLAGKSIRKDYYEVFECALKDEIAYRISELELAWQFEDDHAGQQQQQAAVERRIEQEQAFQGDHKPLIDAYGTLEKAFTGREKAVQAGYDLAGQFAEKLEKRMARHEQFLENVGGEVLGLVQDVRVQQRRDDHVSQADHIVRVGKNTLSCLFWLTIGGLVVFFGIFLALYLAFPHH